MITPTTHGTRTGIGNILSDPRLAGHDLSSPRLLARSVFELLTGSGILLGVSLLARQLLADQSLAYPARTSILGGLLSLSRADHSLSLTGFLPALLVVGLLTAALVWLLVGQRARGLRLVAMFLWGGVAANLLELLVRGSVRDYLLVPHTILSSGDVLEFLGLLYLAPALFGYLFAANGSGRR